VHRGRDIAPHRIPEPQLDVAIHGAGITQPVNLVGLPAFLTLQADFILPSENKSVTFGNPATASQSFFVKQSEVVVKGSVTMTTQEMALAIARAFPY
jgi:hypothetical protein